MYSDGCQEHSLYKSKAEGASWIHDSLCVSYFSAAITKHHDKKQLMEGRVCLDLRLQRDKSPSPHSIKQQTSQRQQEMETGAHILNKMQIEQTRSDLRLKLSKPTFSDVHFPVAPSSLP